MKNLLLVAFALTLGSSVAFSQTATKKECTGKCKKATATCATATTTAVASEVAATNQKQAIAPASTGLASDGPALTQKKFDATRQQQATSSATISSSPREVATGTTKLTK